MVVVALPDGTLTTQTYDAAGLRRQSETAAGAVKFVWDAPDVLLETDGSGAMQAAYTHGPGTYGPLIAQRRGGASSFHHFDALGSTTELTGAAETSIMFVKV
jgi:YD repeat-containing protein